MNGREDSAIHFPRLWLLCLVASLLSAVVAGTLLLSSDRDFSSFIGPLLAAVVFGLLGYLAAP